MAAFGGQAQFEATLRQHRAAAEAEALRACEVSANELAARVKRTLGKGDPRRGHLADTIEVYRKSATTWAVRVGNAALDYAAFLEFGHKAPDGSRVKPQKFFFPSVRIINKKHRRRIRSWFRNALKGG